MNEPIMPREQGRYACWVKDHQREADAHSYAWANHRATPRHAAQEFAEDIVDHGRHPELLGKPIQICVRDKHDGSLSVFNIGWEPEIMPFIAGEVVPPRRVGGVVYG